MTQKQITKLVDDAIALHREIAAKTEQFKALKTELVQQARLHPEAQVLTESGGMRWTAKGTDGCIARVSFPTPGLVSQIQLGSEESDQIIAITGNEFSRLFAAVKAYQPVPDFRAQAVAVLPSPKVKALFGICETESAPRVSFEAAKRAELANAR